MKFNDLFATPIGIIGLGNMGLPISSNMKKAGITVMGYDTIESQTAAAKANGVTIAQSISELAAACDVILLALPSVDALRDVCTQLAEHCKPNAIICEMGTLPIGEKQAMRVLLQNKGAVLLDTPLSGTGAQAKTGDVVVLGSGDEAAFTHCLPALRGFSKSQHYLGEFGNGMKMKLVANQLVAIHNAAAAEAVLFASRLGLDMEHVVDILAEGAGGSRMLEVRGPVMINRSWHETQIAVQVFQKDMRLIDEALWQTQCPSPTFQATKPLYAAALASGHGKDDACAIYAVLEAMVSKDR